MEARTLYGRVVHQRINTNADEIASTYKEVQLLSNSELKITISEEAEIAVQAALVNQLTLQLPPNQELVSTIHVEEIVREAKELEADLKAVGVLPPTDRCPLKPLSELERNEKFETVLDAVAPEEEVVQRMLLSQLADQKYMRFVESRHNSKKSCEEPTPTDDVNAQQDIFVAATEDDSGN